MVILKSVDEGLNIVNIKERRTVRRLFKEAR